MATKENPFAVANQETGSLSSLLKQDVYANRFKQVLGERTPQFISSLISVGNSPTMKGVEPKSIIGAAMTAACLDLPIDKNLGFAWIVPFKGIGQFQMGYRGYIQLGLRSAQYQRMNATAINKEVFKGWDCVGEPTLDWNEYDPEKTTWGYFFGFQLVNGFTKTAVWTKEKVLEHAKRYSQAFRAGADIWNTQFDGMALKTVISNTLRKWGPLSVQMQQAFMADQAVIRDIDAAPEFVDNGEPEKPVLEHPEKAKQLQQQKQEEKLDNSNPELAPVKKEELKVEPKPAPKQEEKKPEPAPVVVVKEPEQTLEPAADDLTSKVVEFPQQETKTEPKPEPVSEPVKKTPPPAKPLTESQAAMKTAFETAEIDWQDFTGWAKNALYSGKPLPVDYRDIPDDRAAYFAKGWRGLKAAITDWKKKKK